MWKQKANQIIASMCRDSWYKANHAPNGKRYKNHRPYSVPHDAQRLVDALGKDDEETAKAIFINHAYGIVYT